MTVRVSLIGLLHHVKCPNLRHLHIDIAHVENVMFNFLICQILLLVINHFVLHTVN